MKKLLVLTVVTYLLLAVYSYSQIDLNLTLSSNPVYQTFQNSLITLGYYQRPLSTLLLALIFVLATYVYLGSIDVSHKKMLTSRNIYALVGILMAIGLVSYPAFSHDIFNYMFDARILTKYNLNPYLYKALDFPSDEWTRFMHWTHRVYPYGPLWLAFSLVPSLLGLQKFTLTLSLFKLAFALFYGLSCYFIYRIAKVIDRNPQESLIFFAVNPLIIIETLISPHNDILVLLLLLIGIYLLVRNRYWASFALTVSSVLIKYTTLPLIIINIYVALKKVNPIKEFEKIISGMCILYLLVFAYLIYARELLSWYGIIFVGVASLLKSTNIIRKLVYVISLALPLKYLQYIYFGTWSTEYERIYLIGNAVLVILIIALHTYQGRILKNTSVLK